MQPLKEIEAAVIGDFVPVESIEVGLGVVCETGECVVYICMYIYIYTLYINTKKNEKEGRGEINPLHQPIQDMQTTDTQ